MHLTMLCNTREVQCNIMWHFSLVHVLPTLKGKKQVMLDVRFLHDSFIPLLSFAGWNVTYSICFLASISYEWGDLGLQTP